MTSADTTLAQREAQRIRDGQQAETELRIVGSGFEVLQARYMEAWSATKPSEVEAREKLWIAYQMAGKVKRHLLETIASGKVSLEHVKKDTGAKRTIPERIKTRRA